MRNRTLKLEPPFTGVHGRLTRDSDLCGRVRNGKQEIYYYPVDKDYALISERVAQNHLMADASRKASAICRDPQLRAVAQHWFTHLPPHHRKHSLYHTLLSALYRGLPTPFISQD